MTNVLLIYESLEPTNQELYKLLSYLSDNRVFSLRRKACMEISKHDIDWCDIVISVRSTSDYESRLSKYAKKLSKFWITALDDDFLSLGDNYGCDIKGYSNERKEQLKKVLGNSNCLLTGNKLLAEKYTYIGNIPRYAMINTPVDCSSMIVPKNNNGKVKIVYYVNDGTRNMFDLYIRPVFERLCELYRDKVALYFLAVHPDLSEYEDKLEIHYVSHMNFDAFLKYIAEARFDIGLAPLDNNGFSRYKYFNKYIEYTRAGIVGIYSDCPLYRQVIVDGYNGLLCDNIADEWICAIEKLINDSELRVKMASNAQCYAKDNFDVKNITQKLLKDVPELYSYKAPSVHVFGLKVLSFRVHYWCFRFRGWMRTIYSCAKTGNIKALFRRIKKKMWGN